MPFVIFLNLFSVRFAALCAHYIVFRTDLYCLSLLVCYSYDNSRLCFVCDFLIVILILSLISLSLYDSPFVCLSFEMYATWFILVSMNFFSLSSFELIQSVMGGLSDPSEGVDSKSLFF